MFKAGEIVYVKVTGEIVAVLSDELDDKVQVRRAVATKDGGIKHNTEFFRSLELETSDEKVAREFELEWERRKLDYKMMQRIKDLTNQEPENPLNVVN